MKLEHKFGQQHNDTTHTRQQRKTTGHCCLSWSLWFDRGFLLWFCCCTVIGSWKVAKPSRHKTQAATHTPHATNHKHQHTQHTAFHKPSRVKPTDPDHTGRAKPSKPSQAKPSRAEPSQAKHTEPHHTTPRHATPRQNRPGQNRPGQNRPGRSKPPLFQGHFQFNENVVDASASSVAALGKGLR